MEGSEARGKELAVLEQTPRTHAPIDHRTLVERAWQQREAMRSPAGTPSSPSPAYPAYQQRDGGRASIPSAATPPTCRRRAESPRPEELLSAPVNGYAARQALRSPNPTSTALALPQDQKLQEADWRVWVEARAEDLSGTAKRLETQLAQCPSDDLREVRWAAEREIRAIRSTLDASASMQAQSQCHVVRREDPPSTLTSHALVNGDRSTESMLSSRSHHNALGERKQLGIVGNTHVPEETLAVHSLPSKMKINQENLVEMGRLQHQAVDLLRERQELCSALHQQTEILARKEKEAEGHIVRCRRLEEIQRRLQQEVHHTNSQLHEKDLEGQRLAHCVEELALDVQRAGAREKELQAKWQEAQDQVRNLTDTRTELMRQTGDTAGELQSTKAKFEAMRSRLEEAEVEKRTSVVSIERDLAAERQRVQDMTGQLHTAQTESKLTAVDLRHCREDLDSCRAELEKDRLEVATTSQASRERIIELELQVRKISHEAAESARKAACLEATCEELEKTKAELDRTRSALSSGSRATEVVQDQLRHEQMSLHAEEENTMKALLELGGLREQREIDSRRFEEKYRALELRSAEATRSYEAEVEQVREQLCATSRELASTTSRLQEAQCVSERLKVAHSETQAQNEELRRTIARSDVTSQRVEERLREVEADREALQRTSSVALSDSANQVDVLAREKRNLEFEVEELRKERQRQVDQLSSEESLRLCVEQKLRKRLEDVETSAQDKHETFVQKNSALMHDVTVLEQLRDDQAMQIRDFQAKLQNVLAEHAADAERRQAELELAKASTARAEEAQRRRVDELAREAVSLRTENSDLTATITRLESLNNGLRAQVCLLQESQSGPRSRPR